MTLTVTPDEAQAPAEPESGTPSDGTLRAARAVLVIGAAEVTGKVATFSVMVVAARRLGTEGFGSFALALAVSLLLQEFARWGFDTMITRDGSRDRTALDHLYADLVALRLALAGTLVGGMALALLLLGRLDEPPGAIMLLLTVSCLLDTFSDGGRAVAAALGRQSGVAAALVVQRIITAAVALTALALGGGLVALGVGFLCGSVAGVVLVQVLLRRYGLALQLGLRDWRRVRQTCRDSLAVGLDSAVSTALFRVDTLLLGALAGTVAVGHYAAAYRLLETVLFINWAVAKAVFPAMSAATEPWQVRRAYERGVSVCAFAFVPYACLLVARGDDVLRLLYGEGFVDHGGATLACLAVAPVFVGMSYLMGFALFALDRPKAVLRASLYALAFNVAGNLVLIPVLDAVGAAITTTASYVVATVASAVPFTRLAGRPHYGRLLAVPLLASVPAVAVLLVGGPLVTSVLLFAVAYLVSWLLLARRLDPELAQVLRRLVPGRLVRSSR